MASTTGPTPAFGPPYVAEGMLRNKGFFTTEGCGDFPGGGDEVCHVVTPMSSGNRMPAFIEWR